VAPDQVVYDVTLSADVSATLSDVAGQLTSIGITAANLSYVSSDGRSVDWSFEQSAPFSKMKDTLAGLSRLKEKLGAAFAFGVVGARTSPDAQLQACPLTSLVSDARNEAARIAAAAGVRLGGIVGLSDGSDIGIPTSAQRIGYFFGTSLPVVMDPTTGNPVIGLIGSILPGPVPISSGPCSLVVQFRLLP
jgi:hypothetical protein